MSALTPPPRRVTTRRGRMGLSRAFIATGLALGVVGLSGLPALGASTDTIPPVKHVWTIVLENSDEAATIAQDSTGTGELTNVLRSQGAWIPNYFGTGHSSLDNYIALASAQGPTQSTQGDCSDDNDPVGGNKLTATFDSDGQALAGAADIAAGKNLCTYPADVPTLGMQLSNAGYSWRTYAQGEDDDPTGLRTTCQSAQYANDTNSSATTNPTETTGAAIPLNYARKHDPELYFYGVTGIGGTAPAAACDKEEVGLGHLPDDLDSESTTPTYSLIIPDLCNDAHDSAFNGVPSVSATGVATAGCKPGSVGPDDRTPATDKGIAQADNFLEYWVPRILASPAYRDNGLLIITFDEGTEGLACCGEVKSPNLSSTSSNGQSGVPSTPATMGGGQIGMVAISPFIRPGTVSTVAYNHFSYVRTMEDMFHLTPDRTGIAGSDGMGHIGYAGSQGGSTSNAPASMGADVFDNLSGTPGTPLPDSRLAVLLPIAGLLLGAGLMTRRIRRETFQAAA